jgi:hypothetical protein
VAIFTNERTIPVTDVMSQSLGQAEVLAPRVFHVNRHSLAARVLHLKRHAIEQGLAPRVFHLNLHATEQALAPRVIHLNRRDPASRVFHLNHPVIGQSLTPKQGYVVCGTRAAQFCTLRTTGPELGKRRRIRLPFPDFAPSKLLGYVFQFRVLLAHDFNPALELLPNAGIRGLSHAALKRRSKYRAAVVQSASLVEMISRPGDGPLRLHLWFPHMELATLPRLSDNMVSLMSMLRSVLPMLPQDFIRRK